MPRAARSDAPGMRLDAPGMRLDTATSANYG
jgi:hypothetical protein